MMHEGMQAFHAGEKDFELPNKTKSLGRGKHCSFVALLFSAGDLQCSAFYHYEWRRSSPLAG